MHFRYVCHLEHSMVYFICVCVWGRYSLKYFVVSERFVSN